MERQKREGKHESDVDVIQRGREGGEEDDNIGRRVKYILFNQSPTNRS